MSRLIFLMACFPLSVPSHALLLKWIDDNGVIRYGDHLPVEMLNKKHFKLDAEGRVVDTIEEGKSPQQLKEERFFLQKQEKDEARAQKLAQEKKLKQRKADRILLLTFNSEDDIFYARDQRLQVLDSKITLLSKNKMSSQKKLQGLEDIANEQYSYMELSIPGGLQQKIERLSENILAIDRAVLQSEKRRSEVIIDFNKSLVRFRDLKKRKRLQKK